ncbi:tryptophan-tRNA ligase [Microthyrium microscopicum]|uniref:Tryptophan--tRNA ligase, mitochondrial n=1 Tax=Microthyrium microscopicum TaxID=703497 RepID=A0A6A6U3Y4_9PEZI|nr:tryptophan-tRNA ligase [Microthyrium microscopicum]
MFSKHSNTRHFKPLRKALLARSQVEISRRCLSSSPTPSKSKVIFSGIQPTGIPHLGNYLGALRQWVKLQETESDDTRLLYSLVDLHAITVKQDPRQLRQWRHESLATLLAIGLDPARSIIFHQSDVPAHSELMWILSCTASVGHLSRMTQWKSKLALPENAKPLDSPLQLGLFSYPVLQAADILVHQATHVPVGEDQSQHLEFTRSCATGFNHLYGDVLTEPETILSPAKRVMSLSKPADKKMSKSDTNYKSRILITDSREEIQRKVKTAVTDSIDGITFDPINRPGIANLVTIMQYLLEDELITPEELVKDIPTKSALKDRVTDVIDAHIEPIRERFNKLMSPDDRDYLIDVAEEGAEMAITSAEETMKKVRDAIGFGSASYK